MYFLLKMGIFQPAMLVYQRVFCFLFLIFFKRMGNEGRKGSQTSGCWEGCSELFSLNGRTVFQCNSESPTPLFGGITEYHRHFHEDLSVFFGNHCFLVIFWMCHSIKMQIVENNIDPKIGSTFNQLPSLKLTARPCKMVGWKTIEFPFGILAYFQGPTCC